MARIFWIWHLEGQTMFQPWLCCHILYICCYEGKRLSSILLFLRKRIRSNRDVFDSNVDVKNCVCSKVLIWRLSKSLGQSCKQMVWLCTHIVSRQKDRHCTCTLYIVLYIEALSRNHCFRGKTLNIKYSECVSVAFGMQYAVRMLCFILSYVACLVYRILPHYLINGNVFGGGGGWEILNLKYVVIFSKLFFLKYFSS